MPTDPTPLLFNALLDVPAFPAGRFAPLADRIGKILGTRNDILLVQAEAVVALEAVAASLARPGLSALNIVTSPYGTWFGQWLARGGADVRHLAAEPGLPITVATVTAALDAAPGIRVLALVHAESASGIVNPLDEIVALARSRGIVTVVDAVASVGGHPLSVDALGVDIAVIGPQKSLGGPAGVSALSVSTSAWDLLNADGAPADSILSLTDLKRMWLDTGRGALPGTPAPLEFWALEAAIARVEAEGIDAVIARHRLASRATRAGLLALGLKLWVGEQQASNLVTAARLPDGIDVARLLQAAASFAMEISPGVGRGAERLVRLNHTGPRARFDIVLANVIAYGQALNALGCRLDIAAASTAISACYAEAIR
jgi:aspartate aminotransferase-like enzyme